MSTIPDSFTAPGDAGTLTRLRHRLGLAAEAEGLLDVAYTTVDSPVGSLLLAATPQGLQREDACHAHHRRLAGGARAVDCPSRSRR